MIDKMPVVPDTNESKITTVIAEDLEIKGAIRFKSSVMLKGVFEGEIHSEGLLVVGAGAKVTATIITKTLVSDGQIIGNVKAGEQIILKNTATHTGDLHAPFISIEGGAIFNGSATMNREEFEASHETKDQESAEAETSCKEEEDKQIRLVG